MSAMTPQAMTAADDLLMTLAGRVRTGAGCAGTAMSERSTGATAFGLAVGTTEDDGATVAAGVAAAGDCSITVPAGRTSRYSCAQEVTIAPTIADFHRSSDAAGDQR